MDNVDIEESDAFRGKKMLPSKALEEMFCETLKHALRVPAAEVCLHQHTGHETTTTAIGSCGALASGPYRTTRTALQSTRSSARQIFMSFLPSTVFSIIREWPKREDSVR